MAESSYRAGRAASGDGDQRSPAASEEIEEGAELKAAPVSMPAGDDGKASPVAGKNDMGGKAVDMSNLSLGYSQCSSH